MTSADALKMVELTGAEFAILSDKDAEVAKDYGVYNLLNDGVATPSAVIVSPGGDIEWKYVGESISDRPTPDANFGSSRPIDTVSRPQFFSIRSNT